MPMTPASRDKLIDRNLPPTSHRWQSHSVCSKECRGNEKSYPATVVGEDAKFSLLSTPSILQLAREGVYLRRHGPATMTLA